MLCPSWAVLQCSSTTLGSGTATVKKLDQFDEAVPLGDDGRSAHAGATRQVRAVSSEIMRAVRREGGRVSRRR